MADRPEKPEPQGWQEDYRLAFPADYLRAEHLRGKDVTLTISDVSLPELQLVGAGKKRKLVLGFKELAARPEGTPRRLVVNKTNAATIAELTGSRKCREWVGTAVTLYATTCRFGKNEDGSTRMVDCIRIRGHAESGRRRGTSGSGSSPPTSE